MLEPISENVSKMVAGGVRYVDRKELKCALEEELETEDKVVSRLKALGEECEMCIRDRECIRPLSSC